jgi:hypothetical protein
VAPTLLSEAGVTASARFDGVPLVGPLAGGKDGERPAILAEVFSHVVPNPAASLIAETAGGTRMYTVNFSDAVDEYYLRDEAGHWGERNGIDDEANGADIAALRKRLLQVFEADERWVSYAAFLRLIHAESFAEGTDLQKFVTS